MKVCERKQLSIYKLQTNFSDQFILNYISRLSHSFNKLFKISLYKKVIGECRSLTIIRKEVVSHEKLLMNTV